jgi:NAD(P)-dependent dehydrogenase (short-subunit alcohol dehydrogenase family)
MVGAYSASKFALEALSDALRIELRPWRIPVSMIRPGQVGTAIFDKAREALIERTEQIPPELLDGYQKLYARAARFNERGAKAATSPDRVARTVLKALKARRPRLHYIVGADAHWLEAARVGLPSRWLENLIAAISGASR